MRYRHDGTRPWTLVLGVGALLGVQAVAWANSRSAGWIYTHGYGLAVIVNCLVVLVEWPALKYVTRYSWTASLGLSALVNFASFLIGGNGMLYTGARGVPMAVPGMLLEVVLVTIAVAVVRRGRHAAGAFVLVLVLNLITGPATDGLHSLVPPNRGNTCLSTQKMIGTATWMYAQDHDGMLPPTHTTDEFLRALAPYGRHQWPVVLRREGVPRSMSCPGNWASKWSLFPSRPKKQPGYVLVGAVPETVGSRNREPSGLPPGTLYLPYELASQRVLLADDEPRHNQGRNCLYYDGHAKWSKGDEALSMGATRDDFVEAPQYAAGDDSADGD